MSLKLSKEFNNIGSNAKLHNCYGPTETTVYVTKLL